MVIITLFVFFFRSQIVDITKKQRAINLRQYAARIDGELQYMSLVASSLIHNTTLMERSQAFINAQTAEQRYLASSEIERIFQTYFVLSHQLTGFYMMFEGEDTPLVLRNYAGISLSDKEIKDYIAMADSMRGTMVIPDNLYFSYRQSSGWFIASLAVSSPEDGRVTGVRSLIVSFVVNPLMDFVRRNNAGEHDPQNDSDYFLYGRNRTILASNDMSLIGSGMNGIAERYGRSWILMEAPVDSSDWTLVEAINLRSLTRPLDTILYILSGALLVIVLFFIRYNAIFFARIFRPIKQMASKMESVGNGDFSVRSESGGFKELNTISESFNYMVEKIGTLTTERTRIEIEALRYQLNPHFLCNALNAIRMMAIITKNDSIRKMSAALMMITEDTLAREDTVYSLEHELHILDNYVYIMQVRYGNTFELIKDADNSLLGLGVPSMILQPLVENAILHGFNGLPGLGTIVVSAALEQEQLVISVRDNGNGMSNETLETIFNDNGSVGRTGLSRIGLYNVRRRIILAYGGAYGVDVASYPGEGTVVTLRLPVQQTQRHTSRVVDKGLS